MIVKFYECSCDYCGHLINHFAYRPDKNDFEEIGAVSYGRKVFCCKKCLSEYVHDLNVSRVGNLKQFKPGKSFKRL